MSFTDILNSTNNVVANNGSITLNVLGYGDVQYVKFNLTAGTRYNFQALGASSNSGTLADPNILGFYNQSGSKLPYTWDDNSGNGLNASVVYTPLTSGTYFASIASQSGTSGSTNITLTSIPSVDTLGGLSNKLSQLTLDLNRSTKGEISVSYAQIWIQLTLNSGESYNFTLNGTSDSAGNSAFPYVNAIYDSTGGKIASFNDPGKISSSSQSFAPTTSGTFWLSVASDQATVGGFQVSESYSNLVVNSPSGTTTLTTGSGNDTLNAAPGTHTWNGGAGFDALALTGPSSNYTWTISSSGNNVTVKDKTNADGIFSLSNVEILKFTDQSVDIDIAGSVTTVAKVLGALFGPSAVQNKTYAGIGISLYNSGYTSAQLADLSLGVLLGSGFTPAAEVTLLYKNLFNSQISSSDLNTYVGLITSGQLTTTGLALTAMDLSLNTTNINLAGLATTGLPFTPSS